MYNFTYTYEHRDGFKYKQPTQRVNGKKYFDYPEGSIEREIWSSLYWEWHSDNYAKKSCCYDSEKWADIKARDEAYKIIKEFIANRGSGTAASITPLMPFEIYLMNDGWKMDRFIELCAQHPMSRIYKKEDKTIFVRFGIIINDRRTNFYWESNFLTGVYQVDNNIEMYEKAIRGELKDLIGVEVHEF
jgi:hypothetical protein